MVESSGGRRMFDIRRNDLDEDGNRVFEIELCAVRTHAGDIRALVGRRGDFVLSYRVSCGEHHKQGSIDPDAPRFSVIFDKKADPDGVWEMVIHAKAGEGDWSKEIWRQRLFVQKERRLSDEAIRELAHRYAPIFVFSKDEKYFPVSLDTLFASPPIQECEDALTIRTVFGKESVPLSRLGEFMRFNGHSEYLLDFNLFSMKRSIFATMGGDPRHATVYYSYFEDPDSDRFFINYHLIYAFDTKTGLARMTGIGPHVFDRESMVLVFDGDKPSSMIISGHLEHQTIFLFKKLKMWTQGRIQVPFDDPRTLKLGTHAVIAVAEGSHALYPTSGVYHLSMLREIAGYLCPEVMRDSGGAGSTSSPLARQVLTPCTVCTEDLPSYALRPMALNQLTSHFGGEEEPGPSPYLVFSGYWVDVAGCQNARFPPFTRKVAEVEDWVGGAYTWEWDDLPESYHSNNNRILQFLEDKLAEL